MANYDITVAKFDVIVRTSKGKKRALKIRLVQSCKECTPTVRSRFEKKIRLI